MTICRAALGCLVTGLCGSAIAQPAPAGDQTPAPPAAPGAPAPTEPVEDTDDKQLVVPDLEQLAEDNATLREEVQHLRDDHKALQKQVDGLQPLRSRVSGYLDFGLFYVSGDGSGIRTASSLGYQTPYGMDTPPDEGGGVPDTWIFVGDPLAVGINSRGEPADTGESRALTFNPIDNDGQLSFIVNTFNVSFLGTINDRLSVTALVDFLPRARNVSDTGMALGDFVDVKLAYGEYRVPMQSAKLTLSAGKLDPVLGVEYRVQDAPDRMSVTPSLICRYTCGRPLGLKFRATMLGDKLTFMTTVTNGSSVVETFPLYSETDKNQNKTIAGRLSYKLPVGGGLEIGASGSYGAQDWQEKSTTAHWHAGADIKLSNLSGLDVTAEYVKGKFEGDTEPGEVLCNLAPCLDYQGAYGQLGYWVTNWLMPHVRVDWRDALHRAGESFVYISDLMRVTGGAKFELGPSVILKAEYTYVRQLGDIPQFKNNVATSSLVLKW